MKISLDWLKEYVRLRESPEKLKADLTMAGLAVESVREADGDAVLELEITSNRPDCLSHYGVARELAALYRRKLQPPPVASDLEPSGRGVPFAIEIRDPDLCPRYTGILIDGVRVGPSPPWLRRRLEAAGMRPLNNIVDITNYVLLELGHPLHAFDFERLAGGRIVVARAHDGATMTTLDGAVRKLDSEMLLINDAARPVAIGGVMGGLDSEIRDSTRTILLECAYFEPTSVRRTSKKLGLLTEAAYRFERRADWDDTVRANARAALLVCELAGGRIAAPVQDIYPAPRRCIQIELSRGRAERLLGVKLTDRFIVSTLERLEFRLEALGRGRWRVTAPSYRADMELEADLIEEIARFYGYDRIPATLPAAGSVGEPSPVARAERETRRLLHGLGYHEAVDLSFAGEAEERQFPAALAVGAPVRIVNPLTEETGSLRTQLAGGLVRSVKRNFNHDTRIVRLFELGKIYGCGPAGVPRERSALGIVGTGGIAGRNWSHPDGGYDFFHLKGVVMALLEGLRAAPAELEPAGDVSWLHPADAARLRIGGETIGVLGSLHPDLEEEYKCRQPVYLAEIDFDALRPHLFRPVEFHPLPKFPAAERDLSVALPRDVAYGALRRGIAELGIVELVSVELVDVYEGENLPAGKRSVTLRLRFQDPLRTLTVDQVQGFSDNVVAFLRSRCGAELR